MQMKFQEWLNLAEMADLKTASTEKIDFQITGDYYNYYFNHNGDSYKASFYRANIEYQGEIIPDVFDLSLKGPNQYGVTRTSGTSGSIVYSNLLLAVKKLIEIVAVNGFQFKGSVGSMDLVYDRFYKTFLKEDFIRVTPDLYLNKSYLKEKFKDGWDKKSTISNIYNTNRNWMQKQKKLKAEKTRLRTITMMLPSLPGKFIWTQETGLSFVEKVNLAEFSLSLIQYRPYTFEFVNVNYKASIIDTNRQPNREEIKEFLQTLTKTRFILTPEAKPLIELMPHYNIEVPNYTTT